MRRGERASSASGAAASKPTKASSTKTDPPSSPDAPVNPFTVAYFSVNVSRIAPALAVAWANIQRDSATKTRISRPPSTTPTLVPNLTPK